MRSSARERNCEVSFRISRVGSFGDEVLEVCCRERAWISHAFLYQGLFYETGMLCVVALVASNGSKGELLCGCPVVWVWGSGLRIGAVKRVSVLVSSAVWTH